jgi:cytochrome c553
MKLFSLLLSAVAVAIAQSAAAQTTKTGATSSSSSAEVPVSMCIGCHSIPGYQSSFPNVYRVPKIGGQSQPYIEAALKAYRQGARNHPSMMAVAKGLTDQQISAVAAYYAARGNAAVVAAAK